MRATTALHSSAGTDWSDCGDEATPVVALWVVVLMETGRKSWSEDEVLSSETRLGNHVSRSAGQLSGCGGSCTDLYGPRVALARLAPSAHWTLHD